MEAVKDVLVYLHTDRLLLNRINHPAHNDIYFYRNFVYTHFKTQNQAVSLVRFPH